MAAVAKAREALDQAVTAYKFAKNCLNTAVSSESPAERTLKNKVDNLNRSLRTLNSTHTSWVSKSELDENALKAHKYSLEWLENEWVACDTLLDQADSKLSVLAAKSVPPVQDNDSKLLILEKQMESLQLEISAKVNSLSQRSSSDDQLTAAVHKVYSDMLSSVKASLSTQFLDLSNGILSLDATQVDTLEAFRQNILTSAVAIELSLAEKEPAPSTPPAALVGTKMEMEKSKAPVFSGRTLDYPEWKRGWNKVAAVYWNDAVQVEQLKLKVDEKTKLIVSRCSTMAEVWSALDAEYAQEQEVVNAVNIRLHQLRSEEGTTEDFIVKLRQHLPALEDALKEVNGLEHLQTPAQVNFLVSNFDERTLHEWEYYCVKNSGSTYERFFKFLLDRYDAARAAIARRNAQFGASLLLSTSSPCTHSNHTPANCPQLLLNVNMTNASGGSDCRKCNKWEPRDGVYICPGCGRGTEKGQKILHCLEHCGAYMAMTPNDRSNCIETAKWCPVHLVRGHQLAECTMKNDSRFVCGVGGCQKHHHKSLHDSNTSFILKVNSTAMFVSENVITLVQDTLSLSGSLTTLWDNGANCSLITKEAAQRLELFGDPVSITVETVTGSETLDSHMYTVSLIDVKGEVHKVTVFAVEKISNHLEAVEIHDAKGEFSEEVQRKWDCLKRPTGEVELLIGLNAFALHPQDLECRGNLKVMASQFGTGYLLGGSHPNIHPNKIEWSDTVSNIRHSSLTINKISIKPTYEFFEGEIMGIQPPKRCGNCKNCKDCQFLSQQLSQKEQYEYSIIDSKVHYIENQQIFHVQYPFTDDPHVLPNNISQVTKIAERLERRLIKNDKLHLFNHEFDKMLEGGAIVELSEEEMGSWDGPAHYISLMPVENEDSATTPLRIVSNSSLSDKNGVSLNSILMKGPNTLSNQWEILNRWRTYQVAMCSDVTKAYWSLRTGEVEKHVRRLVWRHGDTGAPWRTFGYCVVNFGDRCAATILEIAIKRTAQMNQEIDQEAAQKIVSDRYVDDLASGGTAVQVERFSGDEVAGQPGTVTQILARGGLKLKTIVTSGETDEEKLKKLGSSVLGVGWFAPTDEIYINLTQNFKIPLDSLLNDPLTLRICLSVLNSIYDPIGLVSPLTIQLKVAFRDLFRQGLNLGWDDLIPPEDQSRWRSLIQMLSSTQTIRFPRCTKPDGTIGKCILVCYFDGSDAAYACVLYIRWVMQDGSIFTSLLSSKARANPLQRSGTPRSEMCAAVIASSLVLSTLRSWSQSFPYPEQVLFIGDSECTLACIEKASVAFGEWFGNRVGAVQENQAKIEEFCPVGTNGQWLHTSSENNAADIASRLDSSPMDIGPLSTWQKGPDYLNLPVSAWPVDRNFAARKNDHIPQEELLKKFRCLLQNTAAEEVVCVSNLLNPFSTNDWDVLIFRTQATLLAAHRFQSLIRKQNVDAKSTAIERIDTAKSLWFRSVMGRTVQATKEGKLKDLDIQDRHGLKVVVGRAQAGLSHFFGKDHLPVIMGDTRIAHLIMMTAHWKDHAGRDVTQAMARHEAWIVNARVLAKKVVRSCIRCRYLRKSLEMQKMAIMPESLLVQCPPFSNIGLDLCGPIVVKSMTNKRATMKIWVVLFLCLNTKAISIELAPGYSTNDFLLAYMCHSSTHGDPVLVHSDRGSQLVAAHKEICDDPLRYDWNAIEASTAHQGTSWKFAPAGAQWRNGAAEAFVKKFKRSFYHMYKETRLSYAELLCAVKRISNVLNHRPVSVQRTKTDAPDSDFLRPLTPNMLITGRSSSGPPRDMLDSDDVNVRYSFIEELERAWWYQYKVQYFDSLVPSRKWLDAKRNISVGDIVLIEYSSKSAPGTYRLGRVIGAEVEGDGLVRTCTVLYKLIKPISALNRDSVEDVVSKQIRVPVQRLVLILPVEEQ